MKPRVNLLTFTIISLSIVNKSHFAHPYSFYRQPQSGSFFSPLKKRFEEDPKINPS